MSIRCRSSNAGVSSNWPRKLNGVISVAELKKRYAHIRNKIRKDSDSNPDSKISEKYEKDLDLLQKPSFSIPISFSRAKLRESESSRSIEKVKEVTTASNTNALQDPLPPNEGKSLRRLVCQENGLVKCIVDAERLNEFGRPRVFAAKMYSFEVGHLSQVGDPKAVVVKRQKIIECDNFNDAESEKVMANRSTRQAELWSSFKHANVILFIDTFYEEGGSRDPFLAMEFANCGDASRFFGDDRRLAPTVIEGLILGIEYLHSGKMSLPDSDFSTGEKYAVWHGDIRPSNVLIAKDDQGNIAAKICDFGLTGEFRKHGTIPTASTDNPRYTAPEVLRLSPSDLEPGEDKIDQLRRKEARKRLMERADVYSLGLTIFELMTGVEPFADDPDAPADGRLARLNSKLVTDDPKEFSLFTPSPHRSISESLYSVLAKCWNYHPLNRYDRVSNLKSTYVALSDHDRSVLKQEEDSGPQATLL